MKARAATLPLNPSTSLATMRMQTVIDWLNIELKGVVAEVAEPEDKGRGLLSSTTSNKTSDIQRVRRARCVDDFVTPRHQR